MCGKIFEGISLPTYESERNLVVCGKILVRRVIQSSNPLEVFLTTFP
jgi:hypothetical protein